MRSQSCGREEQEWKDVEVCASDRTTLLRWESVSLRPCTPRMRLRASTPLGGRECGGRAGEGATRLGSLTRAFSLRWWGFLWGKAQQCTAKKDMSQTGRNAFFPTSDWALIDPSSKHSVHHVTGFLQALSARRILIVQIPRTAAASRARSARLVLPTGCGAQRSS